MGCDGEGKDDSIEDSELVMADNEESVIMSDDGGRKISIVGCYVNSYVLIDDDLTVYSEPLMGDEVYLDDCDTDLVGKVNFVMESTDAANSDGVLESGNAVSFNGGAFDSVDEVENGMAAVGEAQEDGISNNGQDTSDVSE